MLVLPQQTVHMYECLNECTVYILYGKTCRSQMRERTIDLHTMYIIQRKNDTLLHSGSSILYSF